MAENRITYRKLPGKRRGILMGSSVWMGPDHLLLVKSSRFREEYKRFYLRDIQAIGIAEAPRFHISTRSLVIGLLWSVAFAAALSVNAFTRTSTAAWITGGCGVLLIVAWVFISAAYSCRCRIFTAVSSEALPSVYRTWTARRFLEQVEPYIGQVQGVIEGNWADAAEERQIGPMVEGRIRAAAPVFVPAPPPMRAPGMVLLPGEVPMPAFPMAPGTAGAVPGVAPQAAVAARSRTIPAILFVASLLVGGAAELLTIRTGVMTARWVFMVFILLQVAAAVTVLVQNFQGVLRPPMRNLAIIMFVITGVWYYAVQVASSMAISFANAQHPDRAAMTLQDSQLAFLNYSWSRGSAGVLHIILGLVGVILLFRGERSDEPVSFNV